MSSLAGIEPGWSEEKFNRVVAELCVANAPRLFALCEVHGDREGASLCGWGMDFGEQEGTIVHELGGFNFGSFSSPERALWLYSHGVDDMLMVPVASRLNGW